MSSRQEKTVRFQDWRSQGRFDAQSSSRGGLELGRLKSAAYSVSDKFHRDEMGSVKKILDPQGSFLQKWNKVFVLSCVVAVSLDPLFFYIPIINGDKRCLELDWKLELIVSVLRSFTDIFYLIHVMFQFRTGFICPSSRVFGRGVLVENSWEIAKRYLSSYFIIDILAVLPLPQIVIVIIVPRLKGARSLNTKNLLKIVAILQYIPRVLRIRPLYKEVTRSSGILTETAWAGAALNLFLYMLASHVSIPEVLCMLVDLISIK
ncbi:hypothetical protein SASPL_110787 [Salvia splendens]|uniref:Cyclic nucleotide gated channel, other eukaryote n=1 Tax=Salvia splendens TaxID=180675 RepID=A0A8X8Y9I5_SALSN|nr:hypothetical protein SASPL_110787 [Salvia splendens]